MREGLPEPARDHTEVNFPLCAPAALAFPLSTILFHFPFSTKRSDLKRAARERIKELSSARRFTKRAAPEPIKELRSTGDSAHGSPAARPSTAKSYATRQTV